MREIVGTGVMRVVAGRLIELPVNKSGLVLSVYMRYMMVYNVSS
jgi:hypothetical protein